MPRHITFAPIDLSDGRYHLGLRGVLEQVSSGPRSHRTIILHRYRCETPAAAGPNVLGQAHTAPGEKCGHVQDDSEWRDGAIVRTRHLTDVL
jgi:hypothetical protein